MVDGMDGVERIRYTSPHPKDVREDVIAAHAELAGVCDTSICRCRAARAGSLSRCAGLHGSTTWSGSG